jgi:alpha-L-rhamnosidase
MNGLIAAINAKLVRPGGFYDDGITVSAGSQGVPGDCTAEAGDALIGNHSQTGQTFAIVYGVAAPSSYPQLGAYIASEGMKQGPMDFGQLGLALVEAGRPDALVTLLTNTAGDGPAKIFAEGGTSMWEQWDPGCSAPGGHAGDNDTYRGAQRTAMAHCCSPTGTSRNNTQGPDLVLPCVVYKRAASGYSCRSLASPPGAS